jgi:hypothetical protein
MSKPAWQSQSFKKGAAPAVRKFADGGEVDLKAEGLAASNADMARRDEGKSDWASFKQGWKDLGSRLSEGNIDDPSSKAYAKYGAGRGKNDRTPDNVSGDEVRMARAAKPAAADDRDDGSASYSKPAQADDRDDGTASYRAPAARAPARPSTPNQSGAETARLARSGTRPTTPDQSAAETARLKATTPKSSSGMGPKNTLAARQEAEVARRRAERQARSETRAAEDAKGYKALNDSMAAARAKRDTDSPPDTRTAAQRSQDRGKKLKSFLGLGD